MALKIVWTKRASASFHNSVNYLEHEWSERSARKFVRKVNDFLKVLQELPEIGKTEISGKEIRGFVISRQITLLYRIKGNKIILLKFFDNRQHPQKKNR